MGRGWGGWGQSQWRTWRNDEGVKWGWWPSMWRRRNSEVIDLTSLRYLITTDTYRRGVRNDCLFDAWKTSKSQVSKPGPAVRGHTRKLCLYCKGYTIPQAFRYNTYCDFSTCGPRSSNKKCGTLPQKGWRTITYLTDNTVRSHYKVRPVTIAYWNNGTKHRHADLRRWRWR